MHNEVLEKFKAYFIELNLEDISTLDDIYDEKILFIDPIHQIEGIADLKVYFQKLNKNLVRGSFYFHDEVVLGNKACLSWEVKLTIKKPRKNITAFGISVLTFDQKIQSQRDYFDAGEMFYEHVPLLGGIIRFFKKKLALS